MEIVNYEKKVLICVFIEGLQIEYSSCLWFFENVGFKVRLMFLFNILTVHYVDSALE